MAVVYSHRVRYHETDAQGFLFNSRYLELADVALTEYFRELGWPYQQLVAGGTDPSVVNAQIIFKTPGRFEDIIDVDVYCTKLGRSSFNLDMVLRRAEEESKEVARLKMVYVNVDAKTATSRPLPVSIARILRERVSEPLPAS